MMRNNKEKSKMDIGVIILCPNFNISDIRITSLSCKHCLYEREIDIILSCYATKDQIREASVYGNVYKSKNTITSLINCGLSKTKHKWSFIVFSGTKFNYFTERKIENFVNSEFDVLFPIVTKQRCDFISSPFNGIMLSKYIFKKAGKFPNVTKDIDFANSFELSKILWAAQAANSGAIFKGIVNLGTF